MYFGIQQSFDEKVQIYPLFWYICYFLWFRDLTARIHKHYLSLHSSQTNVPYIHSLEQPSCTDSLPLIYSLPSLESLNCSLQNKHVYVYLRSPLVFAPWLVLIREMALKKLLSDSAAWIPFCSWLLCLLSVGRFVSFLAVLFASLSALSFLFAAPFLVVPFSVSGTSSSIHQERELFWMPELWSVFLMA